MVSSSWSEESYYDVAWSELFIRSDQISSRLQIDPLRVQHALEVSAIDWNGNSYPRAFDGRDPLEYGLAFNPYIEEAIFLLGPEKAFRAFETEDCRNLAQRCDLWAYLQDRLTPFLTTSELAERYSLFARYLRSNEATLVKTGYPDRPFTRCEWLDCFFTSLLPTKAPLDLYAGNGGKRRTPQSDGRYHPLWSKTSSSREWLPFGPLIHLDVSEADDSCSFDEADDFHWLDEQAVQFIEARREKFLRAKIELFERCASLLRLGDVEGVWGKCLEVVTEAFDGAEADALLEIDDRNDAHRRVDVPWLAYAELAPEPVGGFKELFKIPAIAEKELLVGVFSRPCQMLYEIDPALLSEDSYFGVLDNPSRHQVDSALSLFMDLQRQERDFWETQVIRINDALSRDFLRDAIITAKVRGRDLGAFTSFVQSFADFQAEHLKRIGQFAPLHAAPQGNSPGDFGQTWHTPDYRKIWWEDEWKELSTNRARVVQLLDSAHGGGSPALSQAFILEEMDIRSTSLFQVFRGCWAWNTLVVSRGKGLYGLNTPEFH